LEVPNDSYLNCRKITEKVLKAFYTN